MNKLAALLALVLTSYTMSGQWKQVPSRPPLPGLDGVYRMYLSDSVMMVMSRDSTGVIRSRDRGVSWQVITAGLPKTRLHIFLRDAGGFLFMGADSGVYQSSDEGITWRRTTIQDQFAHNMYDVAEHKGKLYLAGDSGIFRSADGGASWTQVFKNNHQNKWIRWLRSDGDRLFASEYHRVLRSVDGGDRWDTLSAKSDYSFIHDYLPMGDTILVARQNDTMYRSVDGGATTVAVLMPVPPNWSANFPVAFVRTGQSIFACAYSKAYRSDDFGFTWIDVSEGLIITTPMGISVYNDTVFLHSYKRGIWCRPVSELLSAGVHGTVVDAVGVAVESVRPNPGSVAVRLPYTAAHTGHVKIVVYDLLQRAALLPVDAVVESGRHELPIDISGLATGTYYCVITADGRTETQRFVVAR